LRTKATLFLSAAVCIVLTAVAYLRLGSNHVAITRSDAGPIDAELQTTVAVDIVRKPPSEHADAQVSPAPAEVPITLRAQALQVMAKYPDDPAQSAPLVRTDEAFIAESVDPQWARSMEADILSEIAQITRGQLVTVDVECRTTMCRIQLLERVALSDGRAEGPPPVFEELVTKLSLGSPKISLIETDGTTTSLAYIRRPDAAQ
jgi:hypothetical protein